MALLEFIKAEITKSEVVDGEDISAFAAEEALHSLLRISAQRLKDDFHECKEFAVWCDS